MSARADALQKKADRLRDEKAVLEKEVRRLEDANEALRKTISMVTKGGEGAVL